MMRINFNRMYCSYVNYNHSKFCFCFNAGSASDGVKEVGRVEQRKNQ